MAQYQYPCAIKVELQWRFGGINIPLKFKIHRKVISPPELSLFTLVSLSGSVVYCR
jgi:hypothetical protein